MTARHADRPIAQLFLDRWSPRAFDGSEIAEEALLTLIEAARWAPSAFNAQPWRFHYARRGTPGWDRLFGLLLPGNQEWAVNASALIVLASESTMAGSSGPRPSHTHSFDTGAAWAHFAMQATLSGFHSHAMAGFDRDRAKTELGLGDTEQAEAAIAIGRIGDPALLPEQLRAREFPSGRKPVAEIAFPA